MSEPKLPFVTGWRRYAVIDGNLTGARGEFWLANEKTATCRCMIYRRQFTDMTPNQRNYWERYGSRRRFAQHIQTHNAYCGIYLYKELRDLIPDVTYNDVVAGVRAWGRGYEHDLGYRMESVRNERLYLVEPIFPDFKTWAKGSSSGSLTEHKAQYEAMVETRRIQLDTRLAVVKSYMLPYELIKLDALIRLSGKTDAF